MLVADPHTYPALVLQAWSGRLALFYISDGLIPDDDDEAWSIGSAPTAHAVLASENVVRRCLQSNTLPEARTRAARMTLRLIDCIETGAWGGGEGHSGRIAFVNAVQVHGPDEMLRRVKDVVKYVE